VDHAASHGARRHGPAQGVRSSFCRWETVAAFHDAVYKKAKRERLRGVRFHETKHTGISALLA